MLFFLCLVAMVIQEPVYSGVSHVDGLGDVAFPPGDWTLEHRTSPTDEEGMPDAYVFKRKGDRLERLSIKRFEPVGALTIGSYFDSIGDSMSNGTPMKIVGKKSEHDSVHILAPVKDLQTSNGKVVCKVSSYIYTSETKPPWMSHAFVCLIDGWVLVGCHASPHALSPEDVQNIYFDSKFKPTKNKRE